MNEQSIRKCAALMRELGLSAIEVDESRNSFRLECLSAQVCETGQQAWHEVGGEQTASVAVQSFTSPMVGVFYSAPAEDAEPFVQVGSTVKKGETLCIIEAMKLMNEVICETDCVVEAVCVADGQLVEYGTELFRLRETAI